MNAIGASALVPSSGAESFESGLMSLMDATDHGGRRYPNSDGMSNELTGGVLCIRGDVII